MCSIKSAQQINSKEDVQLLVIDTLHEQNGFFTYSNVKKKIMRIVCLADQIIAEKKNDDLIDDLLCSNLLFLQKQRRVIRLSNHIFYYCDPV